MRAKAKVDPDPKKDDIWVSKNSRNRVTVTAVKGCKALYTYLDGSVGSMPIGTFKAYFEKATSS